MAPQVFLEDAGFDWKILGPDVSNEAYVAWQCDQDAYACSGQKCSAQSVLFMHSNWAQAGAFLHETPCHHGLSQSILEDDLMSTMRVL